jgi:hypothetical protein
MSHRSALCMALLGCACGGAPEDAGAVESRPGSSYADGRVPVRGCESFDYGGCDIREPACVDNLAAIAHCLRGSDTTLPMPELAYVSQAEAERELALLFPPEPPAEVNHLEVALTQLGLTQRGALSPTAQAERYAREWAAFYSQARQVIVVIEHAARLDALNENVVLVHEMIHALQDTEHDLEAFGQRYGLGVDADLRSSSVVEGEARLHERRYFAARAGLDAAELDLQRSFDNLRDASERWLFEQGDLYSASQLSVPYAHGAAYVFDVWSEGGSSAVRALFDAPPSSMREVLATSWGGELSVPLEPFPAPTEAASGLGFERSPGEAKLETSTSMGAWGLYLLVRSKLDDAESARSLALGWRGDLLEVFSLAAGETAARWQLQLGDALAAARVAELLSDMPGVTASAAEARVTLLTTPAL